MRVVTYSLVAGVAGLVMAGVAQATTIEKSTRDALDTEFFPGSGNPNTDFAITRITEDDGNVIEIGIKGKQRFVGQENVGGSGANYVVPTGYSVTSAGDLSPDPDSGLAWWNFDFSVDLGDRSLADSMVGLRIEDPEGDEFLLPDFGSFMDQETSLIQNSWNIGFGFIEAGLGAFQPNLRGTYGISFTVSDFETETMFGTQAITVQVPSPATMALFGMGLLGLGVAARRRRR